MINTDRLRVAMKLLYDSEMAIDDTDAPLVASIYDALEAEFDAGRGYVKTSEEEKAFATGHKMGWDARGGYEEYRGFQDGIEEVMRGRVQPARTPLENAMREGFEYSDLPRARPELGPGHTTIEEELMRAAGELDSGLRLPPSWRE